MTKSEHLISLDLDDERTEGIAEILGSKTCKKILSLLSEKEMSQSEIASELGLPINTVEYNIKKLVGSGFIEADGGFLWSIKGKRILKYHVVNKKIVITPKFSLKGVLPVIALSGVAGMFLNRIFEKGYMISETASKTLVENISGPLMATGIASSSAAERTADVANYGNQVASGMGNVGLWFVFGVLFGLLLFLIWNWRRIW